MDFMISGFDLINNHRRKVTDMTTYKMNSQNESERADLMQLRREKRRERRRRQLDAFYRSITEQSADKLIFLFDSDMNIA